MAFLNQVSNQANIVCSKKNKKTVFPDHVIDALMELNMESYVASIASVTPMEGPKEAGKKPAMTNHRDRILERLNESEGLRRPFGRSRGRKDKDNGMTQD